MAADISLLLSDFFEGDDLGRLTQDAGEILACPLMVIDDTFRVAAHYTPGGFFDEVFSETVKKGEVAYEVGAIIAASGKLSEGRADFVELEGTAFRRRFAPLVSAKVRLGYLVCVDAKNNLEAVDPKIYAQIESVLSKQLFVQAGRFDKPFETAEEILIHLLDGGFQSRSFFRLQASSTYLADFHPEAFALIDLAAYNSRYPGKIQLKDEITYRFPKSHPFLHNGKIFMFLHEGSSRAALTSLAEELSLKIVVSGKLGELYELPLLYKTALEALDIISSRDFRSGSVFSVCELAVPLVLNKIRLCGDLLSPQILALASHDKKRDTQYCETLYYYLACSRSLKETCEMLFTHRNTVLYRIQKMKEDFEIPLDDPKAHFRLLLEVSIVLFKDKGADFFCEVNNPGETERNG